MKCICHNTKAEKSPSMFCGDGRCSLQQQGQRKSGEGLRYYYNVRKCQGLGDAGQCDGGGPVSTLLLLKLENNVRRRKEKQSHEMSSYETKKR